MECRDVKSIESSPAGFKAVITLTWPLLQDFDFFKKEIRGRLSTENVIALYYYNGVEVMSITSTRDLHTCLHYFKTREVTYRNWLVFSKLYAVISTKNESSCGQHSQTHGQCNGKVKVLVTTADLVNRVLESLVVTTEGTGDDETLMHFAFRVHTQYGSQVTVVSPDVAFCEVRRKSIQLNKPFQMANINDHVRYHRCCKGEDNLGVYFWIMGAHITKLKHMIIRL